MRWPDLSKELKKQRELAAGVNELKANTDYTGYTATSNVVLWFWKLVEGFNKEDMERLLQFMTRTSKLQPAGPTRVLFKGKISRTYA